MTERARPGTEGYWSEVSTDGSGPDEATVRSLLADELDGDLRGLVVTRRTESAVYALASEFVTDGVPVPEAFQITTYCIDLDDDAVRRAQEPFWIPVDAMDGLARLVGRGSGDLRARDRGDDLPAPLLDSLVDGLDVSLLLDREVDPHDDGVEGQHVEKMEKYVGIDPSRPWGFGAGPPPEVERTVERLEEAGLDPDEHLARLVWGKKSPFDRVPVGVDRLSGNYAVELLPRDSGLIGIDVDYPEAWPEGIDLPDTFEVSTAHGDDSQRHVYLRCDAKEQIADEIGGWAVQGVEWGDLWIGDRFLVGAGSQLSEFACSKEGHDRDEPGGCASCEDPDGGYYSITNDAPIATVSAEWVLDLLARSDGYRLRESPTSPEPPGGDDDGDDGDPLTCDACERQHDDETTLKVLAVGDSTRRICRGGCS